jgi:hypothetical protein
MDLMSAITNTIADSAFRMQNLHYDKMIQHQKKISSGKQINSAADVPAGLAISQKLLNRDTELTIEILSNITGITGVSFPTGSWLEEGIHEINVTTEKNVADINNNCIGEYDDTFLTFSPDGSNIAFISNRDYYNFLDKIKEL